jgi:hypothetical protein
VAEAGWGDGKNVCVAWGRGCGSRVGGFIYPPLGAVAPKARRRLGRRSAEARRRPEKSKRAITLVEVMALCVELGCWSAAGYITPLSSAG